VHRNKSQYNYIFIHFGLGLIVLFFFHYGIGVVIRTDTIARYDYGLLENLRLYGQVHPPNYELVDIPKDFPLFLGMGRLDMLADVEDVQFLLSYELKHHDPNKLVQVLKENYAHADFIMSVNAKQDVYDPMIDFFNKQ